MTAPFEKPIYLSGTNEDLLIELWAPVAGGADSFRRISFRGSAVDTLEELAPKISAICLRNGAVIPVAMAFDDLKQQIFTPDFKTGLKLDLTLVTGEVALVDLAGVQALARRVPAAEPSDGNTGVRITAIVRKPNTEDTVIHMFNEAEMDSFSPKETSRSKLGQCVSISFNKQASVPFGGGRSLMVDMAYDDFVQYLTEARCRPEKKLDLVQVFKAHPNKYGLKA